MEIFTSEAARRAIPPKRDFYNSRVRIILAVVVCLAATVLFGSMAYWAAFLDKKKDGNGFAYFALAMMTIMLILSVRNFTKLASAGKPVFTMDHEGLSFPNGMRIAWTNIESNTFTTQYSGPFPTARAITLKLREGKPKKLAVKATLLAVSADEYLELSDIYSNA